MIEFSDNLKRLLPEARKVAVLTGAGISAESGLATFRGADGIWKKFRPEELASFEAFQRNPQLVWDWYQHRRQILKQARPNPGHFALAALERFYPEFTLITQNVDGLHHRAGSRNVLELHGNIRYNKCIVCGRRTDREEFNSNAVTPACDCGGKLRPDVVWFGEFLPEKVLNAAYLAAQTCQLFFAIGTSAIVQPAASLPLVARQCGAYLVEINLEGTEISGMVDETLTGSAGTILLGLVEYLGLTVESVESK